MPARVSQMCFCKNLDHFPSELRWPATTTTCRWNNKSHRLVGYFCVRREEVSCHELDARIQAGLPFCENHEPLYYRPNELRPILVVDESMMPDF